MTASLLAVAFTFTAAICTTTAVLAWRRRANTPAAAALTAAMAGIALWSVTGVFAHLPVELTWQRLTGRVSFVGIHLTVVGLWCFSRAATDRRWRLRRVVALRLVTASALLVGAVLTNPWHQLVFSSARASATDGLLQVEFGPLFWVEVAYCYLLLGWGLLHLMRVWWRAESVFRRQLSRLLFAWCVPLVGNFAVLAVTSGGRDEYAVDYTPLFLAVTGLINAWAIFRHGLLRLVPVVRAQVVDGIEDAVVVIDPEGQVIDVNPAAVALLSRCPDRAKEMIGSPVAQVLPPQLSGLLRGEVGREHAELDAGVHVDARVSPLRDARGRALGQVVVLRDISELVEQREVAQRANELAQRANERLNEQLALTRALQQRLAEEAVRDSLTGLHNRRHLVQVLEQALVHARRSGEPLSVVLIDVDRFKAVNDAHGHHGGDVVLQAVAAQLRDGCRAGDTLARYGGEEFVLLLPATTRADAVERAEQLRRRCAQAVVDLAAPPSTSTPTGPVSSPRQGVSISVTFSAGVATAPEHGTDAGGLIAVADRALYAAKAAGRNRVVAAR